MKHRNFNLPTRYLFIVSFFLGIQLPIGASASLSQAARRTVQRCGIPRTINTSTVAPIAVSARRYSVLSRPAVRPTGTQAGIGISGAQTSTAFSTKKPFSRAFSSQRYDPDERLKKITRQEIEQKIANNNKWINWITGNIDRDLTYRDLSGLDLTGLDLSHFDITGSNVDDASGFDSSTLSAKQQGQLYNTRQEQLYNTPRSQELRKQKENDARWEIEKEKFAMLWKQAIGEKKYNLMYNLHDKFGARNLAIEWARIDSGWKSYESRILPELRQLDRKAFFKEELAEARRLADRQRGYEEMADWQRKRDERERQRQKEEQERREQQQEEKKDSGGQQQNSKPTSEERSKALKVLGLGSNASTEEIKTKYRELAKQWHPDRNPNNPNAIKKFQEISNAYESLFPKPKPERV